jgi:phosphatidylglycerophosphatase C
MGMPHDESQPPPQRPIVAFDFDGTLTVRDSFMSYLAFRAGPAGYLAGMVRLVPAVFLYLLRRDRGRLKAAAARIFLRGMTAGELDASVERFAAGAFSGLIRPDAAQAWRDWQARGALMCIVTASPEATVAPFARRLGADRLIGTGLELDGEGRITGRLSTENCRARQKVHRLQAAFGDGLVLAAAYGDTSGDHEMIAIAEVKGYRVFTGRP